jgi:aminoglycoside 3-N-acetyltransferase
MSLFERMSGLAVRTLSPQQVAALRDRYLGLRMRIAPLMRAAYGSFDAEELRTHLEKTIGKDFEVLMVHCSVNNLQPMYTEGPLELLKMLTAYCSPDRTLAMPAFYFGDPDIGSLAVEFARKPRFDLRRTPSQMGLLSEMFRRSRGVVSSRHPIYRVSATGPLAAALVNGHENAELACGRGSPFDFMASHKTLILGIGKPFEVLTHVHHAEDLMGDEFPVPAERPSPTRMMLVDGGSEIPFELRRRTLAWQRDMWRLRGIMTPSTLREWKYRGVPMFATRAADVTAALVAAARQGRTLYVTS